MRLGSDRKHHLTELDDARERTPQQWVDVWTTLQNQYRKINDFQKLSGRPSYFSLDIASKKQRRLERNLLKNSEELYEAMAASLGEKASTEPPYTADAGGGQSLTTPCCRCQVDAGYQL